MLSRLQKIIDYRLPSRGRFIGLAERSNTSAPAWNHIYHGRSKPTGEQLEAVCKMFPEYTLWLMTGQTNEAAGQTSPDIEQLEQLQRAVSGTMKTAMHGGKGNT